MKNQKQLRVLVLGITVLFLAFASYADTVTLSTFYPSPYGSYQQLDTTGETHLATDAAAEVGIGVPVGTVPGAKLDIRSADEFVLTLRRDQAANDKGQFVGFFGGLTGQTPRGSIGFGKQARATTLFLQTS